MKVSIIVPVYNVEKYLERCMNTLLNQTLKDIEIIMVDDGSPDNCPQMCDEYAKKDPRIKVLHKKNEGLGFARNSGMEIARGEYIAFVDSDDYVDINMYEILYSNAKKWELDAIFCGYNRVNNHTIQSIKEVNSLKIFNHHQDIQEVLLNMIGTKPDCSVDRKYQMSVWHALYSRDIIKNHEIKFPSEREFISEDIIFHIDFLQKVSKIAFIADPLYYYCVNEDSLTKSYRGDKFEKFVVLYKEIIHRLPILENNDSANRFLIGYTRSLMFLLTRYKNSIDDKIQIIKGICNHSVWEQIINKYEYYRLPLYQKLMFVCLKNKLYYTLLLLSYSKSFYKKLVQ